MQTQADIDREKVGSRNFIACMFGGLAVGVAVIGTAAYNINPSFERAVDSIFKPSSVEKSTRTAPYRGGFTARHGR